MDVEGVLRELIRKELSPSNGSVVYKHTTPSGTVSHPYYGANSLGLFGVSGLERDVISTRVHAKGLASILPARPSNVMFPRFPYLMGYDNPSGTNPVAVCDDPRTAGPARTCIQTADFGRYSFQTREYDITQVGAQWDRGFFEDLNLVNDPLLEMMGSIAQPNVPGSPALIGREMLQRFVEVGVSFQNQLVRQVYVGNPANDTANDGYEEFPGLDILVSTGKVDAITGTVCPGLDSDVKNYNCVNITTPAVGAANHIVNVLTYILRMLKYRAERMNLDPVTFGITMRQALFWELTALWPCSYLTYRCQVAGNERVNIDGAEQVRMRDAMRGGSYLLIDGEQFPVIIDDGIVEDSSTTMAGIGAGCFCSDIYILPFTIRGGVPSLFWQYYDFNQGPMQAVTDGSLGSYYWTDGGRYLWHAKPPRNTCVQHAAWIRPRLVLTTPHLAGRLMNVGYCPLQHENTPFPGDPYNLAGGVGQRAAASSLYANWPT